MFENISACSINFSQNSIYNLHDSPGKDFFQVSILSGSFGTDVSSSLMTTVLFVKLLGRSLSIGFTVTGPTLTWTSRAALHDDQLMDFIAARYT